MDRQDRRTFWASLEPYWQDEQPGWVTYEFPNGRRLAIEGEPSGVTVTYDGPDGEVTVAATPDEQVKLAEEVMAMPPWRP